MCLGPVTVQQGTRRSELCYKTGKRIRGMRLVTENQNTQQTERYNEMNQDLPD